MHIKRLGYTSSMALLLHLAVYLKGIPSILNCSDSFNHLSQDLPAERRRIATADWSVHSSPSRSPLSSASDPATQQIVRAPENTMLATERPAKARSGWSEGSAWGVWEKAAGGRARIPEVDCTVGTRSALAHAQLASEAMARGLSGRKMAAESGDSLEIPAVGRRRECHRGEEGESLLLSVHSRFPAARFPCVHQILKGQAETTVSA